MLIYGFSNGFYRWSTFVGAPTSEVLGQTLNQSEIIPIRIRPAASFGRTVRKRFKRFLILNRSCPEVHFLFHSK
ncbi:hypothetical protein IQA49_15190 [Leptospira borgpetersenii serovar Ballum]|uniref:Uncharacterized protein n=1 Tax=Leptospira borgpetersenii serovar Ballum TaxID=280505 RepID=A0A0E3BL60_LEPBO|nr:hypothetical protein LBBP_02163 [Leptospira borgpetersenii serovar Ballum]EMN58754.1 hypothetical protein LEP1GSC090_0973 [Leptospira borgpetersenii serovar Javanica str. MK146]MBF3374721.1 hypothetical protein [Leptospira borgpetersenii serovar Arborea]QHE27066.1 hypothetical protein GS524_08735 [Leptospira borgpetersenii]KGE22600.1 hypothetical protein IQ66_15905 [Leptospira borgpetersenii serovar Ballum]